MSDATAAAWETAATGSGSNSNNGGGGGGMTGWTVVRQLVAGGGAGAIADCFTHPLDTIRARLQTLQTIPSSSSLSSSSIMLRKPTLVTSFVSLAKTEGIRGLYRGFAAAILGTVPAHALYFGGYELSRSYLVDLRRPAGSNSASAAGSHRGDWMDHAVSGLVAELGGALVWVPADVIKQKVQTNVYASSREALQGVWKTEGLRGLFRGFWVAVVTYGPFASLYFVVYEQLKHELAKRRTVDATMEARARRKQDQVQVQVQVQAGRDLSLVASMGCGFVAGAVAAAATCPLDVIKTQLQVEAGRTYSSAWNVAKILYARHGWRGFTRGIGARISWIAPGTAITIAAFEALSTASVPFLS
ncbi:mitochondrial solute carrier family 25 (mitochondrial iron transporter) member 28/37 [Andalucia godoyi]|uniref:Mitochondrial solute carrier family 25 (Mitochondrial iron transporter) member 28/37 n=1 Tax=Andalucia godoyi TaxID=505711 RepID=A0A8K0AK36_ANDGO|nr:mitochondrial solute carrier family 25 (mitochondrial iron transporter) member 28/37 [Andalucia godoyi]|eukprot:ANDGO_07142.mRNA.1 mitochondrial solute carrier family 25 (mitochondrial iron transporter) member 28/37